jgi:hypothetical protein
MRKDLEQKFQERWPEWFRDLYGDVTQTCLHFGFQHRDGWFDLVWRLCEQIEKVVGEGTPFKVAQVKEKFGGLRFYFEVVTTPPTPSAPVLRLPRRSPSTFARRVANRGT